MLKEYSHMLSTPTYYKVVKALIDEVCELFGAPISEWTRSALNFPFYQRNYGFTQVPICATYNTSINPDDIMATYKDLDGVIGFMSAPWFRTRETDVLKHFAEAKVVKSAFEKYFP